MDSAVLGTPDWVTPNRLSWFRIYVIPIIAVSYYAHPSVAFALYLIACVTDWYDGRLARLRGPMTEEGKVLDERADKLLAIGTTLLFSWLIGSGSLNFTLSIVLLGCVAVILLRDGVVTRLREMWPERAVKVPSLRKAKWKTAVLMVGFAFVFLGGMEHPYWQFAADFGTGIVFVSMVLAVWSGAEYVNLFLSMKG